MRTHDAVLLLSFVSFLATAGIPRRALADVVPPAGDCEGKKAGEACVDEDKKPGACGTISYTRSLPPTTDGPSPSYTSSYFGCRAGDAPAKKSGLGGMCSVATPGSKSEGPVGGIVLVACALGATAARRRRR